MRSNRFIYFLLALSIILNIIGAYCLWSATRPFYHGLTLSSWTLESIRQSGTFYELGGMVVLSASSGIVLISICVLEAEKMRLLAKKWRSFLAKVAST